MSTKLFRIETVVGVALVAVAALFYKSRVRPTPTLWEPPVPGTDAMARGYNLFAGQYFVVEQSKNIGDFVFPEDATQAKTITLGSFTYTVVEALTVTGAYTCEKMGEEYSALATSSATDMRSEGDKKSYGFDQTVTVSESVPVGGGEASASMDVRTALLFGNTNYMTESKSYSSQNFSYRSSVEYNARAFDAKVEWSDAVFHLSSDFISAFNDVAVYTTTADRNKKVFGFFNTYGSHVIKEAFFGAKCTKETFYKAGNTQSSYSRVEQTIKNHEVEIFGIQFGGESSEGSSENTDESTAVTYKITGEKCDGIVENNGCNHEQDAVSLQPIVMQGNGLPMWTMNVPTLTTDAKKTFQDTVDYLVAQASKCSNERCNQNNGNGTCVLKQQFWKDISMGVFDGVVDNDSFEEACVCDIGEGPNCTPANPIETITFDAIYHVQNGFSTWSGGYLDTSGSGCEKNKLCVSTASSKNRDGASGKWQVLSLQGRMGDVMNGDLVSLKNMYGDDGGYLDTRDSGCEKNHLCVSTATSSNREGNSGTWKVISTDASADFITPNMEIQLINQFGGNGGYLDTRDSGCEKNLLCVSTCSSQQRDHNSTFWRFVKQD